MIGFLRGRGEAVFIILALALFAAGLATFLSRRGESSQRETANEDTRTAVGPSPGETVSVYIDSRKAELSKAATQDPQKTSIAVVSLVGYFKPTQVDSLLATQKLRALEAQWRLPIPDSKVETASVKATVAETMQQAVADAVAGLTDDVGQFETYAKEAALPEERAQFAADSHAGRQLIDALSADPALVFAVVVRGSHAALAEVSKSPDVRLVDLVPGGDVATRRFTALDPGKTDKV